MESCLQRSLSQFGGHTSHVLEGIATSWKKAAQEMTGEKTQIFVVLKQLKLWDYSPATTSAFFTNAMSSLITSSVTNGMWQMTALLGELVCM